MPSGGFDCVIGNPSYIRIQAMKELAPAADTESSWPTNARRKYFLGLLNCGLVDRRSHQGATQMRRGYYS
jgi:Eco57I restriction-modification methylase